MSKKFIQFYWICLVILGLFFGCASFREPLEPAGYKTQKRIVRQGTMVVWDASVTIAPIQAIYFGYDRNRDYARHNSAIPCKGVDLVEYKRLYPDGHWNYYPFLILSDENYDCYIDHGWLDCKDDGMMKTIVVLPVNSITLEAIDGNHVGHFKIQCQ